MQTLLSPSSTNKQKEVKVGRVSRALYLPLQLGTNSLSSLLNDYPVLINDHKNTSPVFKSKNQTKMSVWRVDPDRTHLVRLEPGVSNPIAQGAEIQNTLKVTGRTGETKLNFLKHTHKKEKLSEYIVLE